jgi:predicted DCC family thiol-disulfide oxidoreductase YuxK
VPESRQAGGRLLVIFDGHCGLCNRSVRWFLTRDRHDRLRFADSESPRISTLLARQGMSGLALAPNTILVVHQPDTPAERVSVRSEAVIALLHELPRPWPALAVAIRLLPRPIRDLGYRLVARFRYRFWGHLETCPIPTATERERFL